MKNEEKKPAKAAAEQPVSLDKTTAEAAAKSEKAVEKASDKAAKSGKDEKPKKERRKVNRKKLKYGGLATAVTVIFLAAVVLLNFVVSAVMDRYPVKFDLTSDKLYEISQESIDYMKTVTQDIDISVMYEETYFQTGSTYLKMVPEILDKYRQYAAGKVTVTFYDMTANPEVVNQFSKLYSGTIQEGDVVVKCGDRIKVINFGNIIASETSMDYTTYQQVTSYSFVGEQSITGAIMSVTDANPKTVGVIGTVNGNAIYYEQNVNSVQMLQNLLDKNGYDVKSIDIATDEISPADYDLLVLPAPYNDLTETMVKKLEAFLYNDGTYGKDLLYFADGFQSTSMPNLNAFLEIWGLRVGNSIIYEGNESVAQYVQLAIGTVSNVPRADITENETYNANLPASNLPIVAPICRPLELLWEANNDRETAALLQSPATAFLRPFATDSADSTDPNAGEPAETTTTAFDQATAETGVQNLMTISTTSFYSGSESYSSHLMAFGSCSMLDYYVVQNAAYRNADYIIGAINTMVGKEASVVISPKALEQTTITITEGQVNGLRNVLVILLPAVIVLVGVVVYVRRRNK